MLTDKGYRKLCKRFNAPGYPHGVTFTCYQKLKFFQDTFACTCFLKALDNARNVHRFDLWAWVIMPEHVHLLISSSPDTPTISPILKTIKQSVARSVIRATRRQTPENLIRYETGLKKPQYRFWQPGGGHDRIIYSSEELLNWLGYVHDNPVRRGLVEGSEDWPWSSARAWINDDDKLLKIDKQSFPII
jgi:putative transposase